MKKDLIMLKDPMEAIKGAHAILIMTEWDMFKDLDYEKIYQDMTKPAFIFDGRNIFDPEKMNEEGFIYNSVGRKLVKK